MSQHSLLSLALLLSISSLDAFAPHRLRTSIISNSSLAAQRQADKKRRFLQQAVPPPAKGVTNTSEKKRSDWANGAQNKPPSNRIKPPLQTSKSIEELESILEKRWGTASTSSKSNEDDENFVMEFDQNDSPNAISARPANRGAANLRSRRVVDPWERAERAKMKYAQNENDGDEEEGQNSPSFNRDDVMLKRVRSNQLRLNNKKNKKRGESQTYNIPINNKDYYDQDDEGYETQGSIISPRPVGGRGRSAALDGGIFSVRDDDRKGRTPKREVTPAKKDHSKDKKPKKKEPQLEQMLDENGDPMYLTLEQAERIVEDILSSDQEGTTSFGDETVDWQDIGITNPSLLSNLLSSEMICPVPLEVQIKACPPIIAGNDVLLSTHTGSGKTLAFLAPIAQNIMINPSNSPLPKALIVAPGRELASQIVSVAQTLFKETGLTVGMVIGGTSYARNVEMLRSKKPDVVVGTPGRVAELIMGRSGDKGGKLKISNLQTVVLDEFDALLQYDAHKEPTNAIIEAMDRQHGQSLQRVLCSATATDMMSTKSESTNVDDYLRSGYAHASIDETDLLVTSSSKGKKATRVSKTTIHGVIHVPHQRLALEAVRKVLNTEPVIQQALIFVDSPRRVDIVIDKLARMDIIAAPLHGGATSGKGDRAEVSKALREGFVGIVVATEMAARGLDAPYLTHVINLDLPTDASHYAHRSGRCGRGGRPGVAISITCNDREKGVPKRFAEELGITMHDVEARGGRLRIVKR